MITQMEGKRKEKIKWKNQTNTHIWFMSFLQILNHFGLHHLLEMVTKHL
jgi:hypothetical protein